MQWNRAVGKGGGGWRLELRNVEMVNERQGNNLTQERRDGRKGKIEKGPRVILRYHEIAEQDQLGDGKLCTRLN